VAFEFLKQCEKEILGWPEEVREDLADTIARLERGQMLSMPLSRPMPSIGAGVHELRFKDRSGIYRVIYFLAGGGTIWFLHAFQKKTQKTSPHDIDVAKERLRRITR
jgi:phage-related protein